MQFDVIYLRDYAQRNQLLDLATVNVDTSGFDSSLLPSGRVQGKTYGIPNSTNAFAMFYDPAKLERLGIPEPDGRWNYSEYKAFLRAVGAKGNGEVYGSADFTGIWWHFNIWIRQKNIQAFTAEGTLGFEKSDLHDWWGLVDDLRQTPALVPASKVTQVEPKSPFGANLAATEMYWDNLISGYMADNGATELKLVPVPSDDPENLGLFLKPSQLMVASARSKFPDQAGRFIDFMVNSPEVGDIFKTSRGIPASKSQRDGTRYEGTDAVVVEYEKSIAGYLQDAHEPPIVGFGTLETSFKRVNSDLNYGVLSLDAAVDQWFEEARDLIQQNQ